MGHFTNASLDKSSTDLQINSFYVVLGDQEVTATLYCNFAYLNWEGDLQYIFAVTSGSPSTKRVFFIYGVTNRLC